MTEVLQLATPAGRYVQGDLFTPQTTDMDGNPLVTKSGPYAGQPRVQFYMGLAIAKNSPEWPAFHAQLLARMRSDWPQFFDAAGNCTNPNFSNKIIDGDGHDQNGRPHSAKEGFAGHWVLRLTSGFAPKCYPTGRYSAVDQIQDPSLLRRGYAVRAFISYETNRNAQKPGMYANLQLVELLGHMPEIITGPDAATAFAAPPAALPAGATAAPMVQGAAPAAAPPAAPYGGYMQPPAPAPVAPPPAPAAPPVPAGPVMTPAANGVTYAQYQAAGWTDQQLRDAGYMA